MRLIDAEALCAYVREHGVLGEYYSDHEREEDIIDMICCQPTIVCHCNVKENAELICKIMDYDVDNEADPMAEVVHCAECESYDQDAHVCNNGNVEIWSLYSCGALSPGWFCANGKRKENAE